MLNKNVIGTKCIRGNVVELMRSNAGYYLGTTDEIGCPNCRITGYGADREGFLESSFEERNCIGNKYCNKGCRCLK